MTWIQRTNGLVMFLVFFSVESVYALLFSHKSWIFYLLSLLIWLALWLLAFLFFKLLSLAAGIVSKRALADRLAVTYFTVIPLFLYNMILVIKIVPGKISSPSNLGVIFFFILLFIIFFLVLSWAWKNSRPAGRNHPPYLVLAILLPVINATNAYWILPDLPGDRWGRHVFSIVLINILLPLIIILVLRAFIRRPAAAKIPALCLMAAVILAAVSLAPIPAFHNPEDQAPSLAQGKPGPNVILIVMDSARAKDVSPYGPCAATTPRLSDLARDSVVFDNAYANSNWTIPSHACLFTGFLSSITRANFLNAETEEVAPLGDQFKSLATILAEHGYSTGTFPANSYFLSRRFGFHQGFQRLWNGISRDSYLLAPMLVYRLFTSPAVKDWMARNFPSDAFRSAADLNAIIFRWLDRPQDKPFFLFVNYMETHGINYLPEFYKKEFEVGMPPKTPVIDPRTDILILKQSAKAYLRSWYRAELHAVDFEVGRVIDFLKKKGVYENSLIVITSDHGELLGEHNRFSHGGYLYQESLHIPLIVKYPRSAAAGTKVSSPVGHVDIFAEILYRLGISPPPDIQGEPFNQITHPVIGESHHISKTSIISRRVPGFKMIEYADGHQELFDILNDPDEQNDLPDSEKRRIIRQELEQYRDSLKKIARKYDRDFEKTKFDSLGYIR